MGCGAPRVRSRRQDTRAAAGLPPGPLRVPARSWLTTWGLIGLQPESRARRRTNVANKHALPLCYLSACGAPRGARVPQGTNHNGLRFSARHPLKPGRLRVAVAICHARESGHPVSGGVGESGESMKRHGILDSRLRGNDRASGAAVVPPRRSHRPPSPLRGRGFRDWNAAVAASVMRYNPRAAKGR
jgi:hypothetical protein